MHLDLKKYTDFFAAEEENIENELNDHFDDIL
jgi:hypothetical protein